MAYEGIQHGNRVTNFSTSDADAVVIDQILTAPTLWSRLNRKAKNFNKPTMKKTVKISRTNLGQSYIGLENLNTSASDTTIQLEYAHNAYTHPAVKIMLEHFANEGAGEDINLGDFIDQEAVAEMAQDLGDKAFSTGAGNDILGLEALIDDGTNSSTFGGQSRSTYSGLNSTVTDTSGSLTLAKMATLVDTVCDTGMNQQTTVMVSNPTVWSLYEQLLTPTVRNNYTLAGKANLGLTDAAINAGNQKSLAATAGFTALSYRGIPYFKDKSSTAQVLYFINENYLHLYGRTTVPSDFKQHVTAVNLGKASALDAATNMPSLYHGWFSQKEIMLPQQAGLVRRYHFIGQIIAWSGRRQGKLTGITTVA